MDPMLVEKPEVPSRYQSTFRQMAREEIWIVAKAFFAPVYGTYLVWRHLLRLTEKADRKAFGIDARKPPSQPAE